MSASLYRSITPENLWASVVKQIEDLIQSGQITPDSRLPSERKLCELLGVSRVSLREALRVLQAKGYVYTVPGSGTFVSTPGRISTWLKSDIEILELFEMRLVIEPELAGFAALRRTPDDLSEMEATITAMRRGVEPINIGDAVIADAEFHQVIARSVYNNPLSQIVDYMTQLSGHERTTSLEIPGQIERAIDDHITIFQAIRNENEVAAREAMKGHLERALKLTNSRPDLDATPGIGKTPEGGAGIE